MNWAKAAVALGLLMLAVGFGLGVEPSSTSANPPGYLCRSVIPASALVTGTPAEPSSTIAVTPQERRAEASCQGVVRRTQWLTWGGLGLGAALLLVGWTAVREQREAPASGQLTRALT